MIDPDVKKVVEEEKIILTTWRELEETRRDKVGSRNRQEQGGVARPDRGGRRV